MRFKIQFTMLVFGFLTAALSVARAQPVEPSPQEILEQTLAAYEKVESYSCFLDAEGMDTFSKERQKRIAANLHMLSKLAGVQTQVEEAPKFVHAAYTVKFMKPYMHQLKIKSADYMPKIIWDAHIDYNPNQDEEFWRIKLKPLPFRLKLKVENDESGGALTSNWTADLLTAAYYARNADMSLLPDAEVDGRPCRVLRFAFDWEKRPYWSRRQPDYDRFDIPEPIRESIWQETLYDERKKFSSVDYFIDRETFLLRRIEERIDGEFHWRNTFRNIQTNALTENDF